MYVDEKNDKCDRCGTVMEAGNMAHGEPGSEPRYLKKDICFKCAGKLDISNCSDCGSIHKYSILDNDYRCRKCSVALKRGEQHA